MRRFVHHPIAYESLCSPPSNHQITRLPNYPIHDRFMIAVLLSGGLDSAVLVAEEALRDEVQPIYVSVGLAWEAEERESARLFLAAGTFARPVRPLVTLAVDMTDVYPAAHWARTGQPPE